MQPNYGEKHSLPSLNLAAIISIVLHALIWNTGANEDWEKNELQTWAMRRGPPSFTQYSSRMEKNNKLKDSFIWKKITTKMLNENAKYGLIIFWSPRREKNDVSFTISESFGKFSKTSKIYLWDFWTYYLGSVWFLRK